MNVAIVGAGKLGIKIAESLTEGDYSITIIDKNADRLEKISQSLDVLTINDDARQVSVLKSLEIGSYDFLLATTGSDDTNMTIAAFAKKLGCKRVIARIREPEHMNQFNFIKDVFNIDFIINPDMAISIEIYKYLAEKYTLDNGTFTAGSLSMIEFTTQEHPALIGKSLPEVRELLPHFLIAGLSRSGKVMIPHGSDQILADDIVYMLGETAEIRQFKTKLLGVAPSKFAHKVMIIGGGKTGYYLAKKLSDFGMLVKIVEIDLARCQYLSSHLDNVMVLHANGTDIDTLEEENLDDMDAFVATTGYDEENLLLALTAKNHNIPDVISKVSHGNYIDLIEKMGVDMVLNPLDITASTIAGIIQGSSKILSSVLIQGQAELIEVNVSEDMFVAGSKIRDLDLPDSVLIAAIHRNTEMIIPNGGTELRAGDRVILLSLLSSINEVEKLLKSKRG